MVEIRSSIGAGDSVGEQGHGQCVEVRAIIVEYHAIILGGEIGGRARPVRLDQGGQGIFGQAVGDSEPAPLAAGQPAAVAGEDRGAARRAQPVGDGGAVEPGRHAHRRPPGQARPPAGVAQIIGDRCERVEMAAPDVGAAVAVAVDGEADEDARQELRVAGGARPAPLQFLARKAALDHAQGGDELVHVSRRRLGSACYLG